MNTVAQTGPIGTMGGIASMGAGGAMGNMYPMTGGYGNVG